MTSWLRHWKRKRGNRLNKDKNKLREASSSDSADMLPSRSMQDKMTLDSVLPIARDLCDYLDASISVEKISPVGSVRRGKPLVSDLDILVASRDEKTVRQLVKAYPEIESIDQEEAGHIAGKIKTGVDFEVIIVLPEDYPEVLFWTTGSKEHRSFVMGNADRSILKGVTSEAEVYERLNMEYIPPELREKRGGD